MFQSERSEMLESFSRGPALLSSGLRRFPKKMWLYKPAPDRWSIHELILHLADSEATAYIRCRGFIAQPGHQILDIDPTRWAGSLGYYYQSSREALEIIPRLRRMTCRLLANLSSVVWSAEVQHPKLGSMTLERWVGLQERHIPHHLRQMSQNFEEWAKTHPPRKPAQMSRHDAMAGREMAILPRAC
ncbi:MAG TPA: DinB family protein [Candidatus Acidoferrum sp.]|nr:DinB family protein [Candidatus Acidoferrum sp.]